MNIGPVLRIMIVDDHPIFRDALTTLLGARAGLEVVGAAGSVRQTLVLLERTTPDLLILDLSLEDGSGLTLARQIRRSRAKTRILVLTGYRDSFAVAEALAAGVSGYLLKEQPMSDLIDAIDAVALGKHYLSPLVAEEVPPGTPATDEQPLARLSPREREIFRLVVIGIATQEIAKRLFVSVKTIETHRTNINRKLGVRTTANLLRFAMAHGISIAPRAPPEDSEPALLVVRDR